MTDSNLNQSTEQEPQERFHNHGGSRCDLCSCVGGSGRMFLARRHFCPDCLIEKLRQPHDGIEVPSPTTSEEHPEPSSPSVEEERQWIVDEFATESPPTDWVIWHVERVLAPPTIGPPNEGEILVPLAALTSLTNQLREAVEWCNEQAGAIENRPLAAIGLLTRADQREVAAYRACAERLEQASDPDARSHA